MLAMNEGGSITGYSSIFKIKQDENALDVKEQNLAKNAECESFIPYRAFAQPPTITKT